MFYNATKDKLLKNPPFDVLPTVFDIPNPPKPVTLKRPSPKPRDDPVPQKKIKKDGPIESPLKESASKEPAIYNSRYMYVMTALSLKYFITRQGLCT